MLRSMPVSLRKVRGKKHYLCYVTVVLVCTRSLICEALAVSYDSNGSQTCKKEATDGYTSPHASDSTTIKAVYVVRMHRTTVGMNGVLGIAGRFHVKITMRTVLSDISTTM